MDQELKQIVGRMTDELETWLSKPSPAGQKVERIRAELAGLKAELGTGVVADTLKTLERAEAETKRARQREAAEGIAELCRKLGVVLEAKEPPKRQRRRPKAKGEDKAKPSKPEDAPGGA